MRMIAQALVTIWIIHHQTSIALLGKEGLNGVMTSTANGLNFGQFTANS